MLYSSTIFLVDLLDTAVWLETQILFLRKKAQRSFETSATTRPTTKRHPIQDLPVIEPRYSSRITQALDFVSSWSVK